MPSSHSEQRDHAFTSLSHKSITYIKALFSPSHRRQLSKLLSNAPPKTSQSKPSIASTSTFHLFSQFPSEIRTLIWTIYISFPRILIPAPSPDPTASNPWPSILFRSPHLHPTLYISHESRSIYQQFSWLETLRHIHLRTQDQVSHSSSSSLSLHSPSLIAFSGSNLRDWETDIFWFKGIPTVKKLWAGSTHNRIQGYENVRKVALDYTVLDYEEEDGHWKKRFQSGWYGLVCVLYLFDHLEEVYFVLDVEGDVKGDVKEGFGEVSFEVVDVEERVARRLEGVHGKANGGDGESRLRFPQLDDRGVYPLAALGRLFRRWEICRGWKKPKVHFVYAKNIGR
ncbi:hypothetical protein SBOR_0385 [Sclerotinia borealis F-4128]|uniref:2EXR domain-containing protein n=1 Tax=Sclerotinia borealis (strain F-4128) TaxID=1432307 RepID=W9CQZ0_SCLBF|nr:hypothetical protein SBOR_0385 [Sclerotinia borealis F-4128]